MTCYAILYGHLTNVFMRPPPPVCNSFDFDFVLTFHLIDMASPSSENGAESAHPIRQTLALEALDAEGLWTALGSVEKALPHLLLCLKPILARLTSQPGESLTKVNPLTQSIGLGEDGAGVGEEAALRAIKDYMAILDVSGSSRSAHLCLTCQRPSGRRCRGDSSFDKCPFGHGQSRGLWKYESMSRPDPRISNMFFVRPLSI